MLKGKDFLNVGPTTYGGVGIAGAAGYGDRAGDKEMPDNGINPDTSGYQGSTGLRKSAIKNKTVEVSYEN
jgi:hypothetical protein